jgi:hypothetical protein
MRLFSIFSLLLSTGCGVFYQDSTSRSVVTYGHQIRTFDETLPEAMEDLFWLCSEPLVLEEGDTEIDLLGICGPGALGGDPGVNALYNILSLGEMQFEEPLTLSDQSETIVQEFRLWRYGCTVEVTPNVTVDRIALYDLDAQWVNHDGVPAMHVDFDFDEGIEADVSFEYSPVRCNPSWLNRYANRFVSRVFDYTHTVSVPDADLDLWITFSRASSFSNRSPSASSMHLEVEVEADMSLGEIDTNSLFDVLPADLREGILDTAGFDSSEHEATIEDDIEDALVGLETVIEMQFASDLESICDIDISGGNLVVMSDDDCISDGSVRGATQYQSRWSR